MPLFESTTIELKQEYTSDLIKTIVAFANTSGGILYIGITDDSQIIGITDADGIMLKAGNAIRGNIKPDVTMFVDYQHEIMEGMLVLKIVVQKALPAHIIWQAKVFVPKEFMSAKAHPQFHQHQRLFCA